MIIFKSRFQPLCGVYLYSAVIWLTVINLFFVINGFVMLAAAIIENWKEWLDSKVVDPINFYTRLLLWILHVPYGVITLLFDLALYRSVKTRNTKLLRRCKICVPSIATFGIAMYLYYLVKFKSQMRLWALYIAYILYRYYLTVIIHYLISDIEMEKEEQEGQRNMSEEEINEFLYGIRKEAALRVESEAFVNLQKQVTYMQYDKSSEISLSNLKYNQKDSLGTGAYGSVYKARLHSKHGTDIIVAVKTTNPLKTDIHYFKALLSEVKVLSRLGKHANVVEFLGASTDYIKKRKLLIALEFCALGSLSNFLKSSTGLFANKLQDGELTTEKQEEQENETDGEILSSEDLIVWSYHIALGMEFLEQNKVIHGDLAARNVLLTEKRIAKITDFGLARQLYSYTVYVKRQNTPLPWRHMALESIIDMSFSSLSDVWSYAVTLWEIFTLANTPWAPHQFNIDFVEQLKQGMRLEFPPFAPKRIYSELMLHCWKKDPSDRPTFCQIVNFFRVQYHFMDLKHPYSK